MHGPRPWPPIAVAAVAVADQEVATRLFLQEVAEVLGAHRGLEVVHVLGAHHLAEQGRRTKVRLGRRG
jgi:hypothetical protein